MTAAESRARRPTQHPLPVSSPPLANPTNNRCITEDSKQCPPKSKAWVPAATTTTYKIKSAGDGAKSITVFFRRDPSASPSDTTGDAITPKATSSILVDTKPPTTPAVPIKFRVVPGKGNATLSFYMSAKDSGVGGVQYMVRWVRGHQLSKVRCRQQASGQYVSPEGSTVTSDTPAVEGVTTDEPQAGADVSTPAVIQGGGASQDDDYGEIEVGLNGGDLGAAAGNGTDSEVVGTDGVVRAPFWSTTVNLTSSKFYYFRLCAPDALGNVGAGILKSAITK